MQAHRKLVRLLQEKKLTLALAESVTCGLAAHHLGTVKGTSDVFMGSIVCYHEDTKACVLKIKRSLLKRYTAESQEVTDALAQQLKKLMDADIYAATTGLAAAGGSETRSKPVGTVFFSILVNSKLHRARKVFTGSPLQIREKSCEFLYREIMRVLEAG